MTLRSKLFYSHLVVMLFSIGAVAVIVGLISFIAIDEVTETENATHQIQDSIIFEEEIIEAETLLNKILFLGLGSAIGISSVIAFITSLFLSRRLTSPILEMVKVTQHISDGYYHQRIKYPGQDELGELARYFNHMAESLDNTEKTRRELLADLTHELNTPLTSIIASVEGIQDGTFSTSTSYSVIHDEALRLQRLVRDVQYLSSAESQIYSLNFETICIYQLLQSVAETLHIQYESKAVELIITYPPQSLMIDADPDRITQVFINLLGNALQYTEPGGHVNLSIQDFNDTVEFIISDTGIGITPSHLKQIFNRFYRVEKSRNRRHGGSGIGLTLAKILVEAHGGYIWAESEGIGQGSQFHFTLPRISTL